MDVFGDEALSMDMISTDVVSIDDVWSIGADPVDTASSYGALASGPRAKLFRSVKL